MKDYIEQRAAELAQYIIDNNATVRGAAKVFNVSKSTVHTGRVTLKLFIRKLRDYALFKDVQSFVHICIKTVNAKILKTA